jgi:DNA replication licensing factor MCM2
MEQQSISISKAGIVTQLQARCSVIAAANPIGGRYDPSRTFSENVELTDPILSRFDILCVVRDTVDPVSDEKLATFVVKSHSRSHPEADADAATAVEVDPDILPQDMLRKYITFSKQQTKPKMNAGDYDKIAQVGKGWLFLAAAAAAAAGVLEALKYCYRVGFCRGITKSRRACCPFFSPFSSRPFFLQVYAELRRESSVTHGMPIAVRHLESMIRMAEARALMHMRSDVVDEDIDVAIRVMLESFISTQKLSVQKALRRKFRRFMVAKADFNQLVMFKLQECMRDARRVEQVTGVVEDETCLTVAVRRLDERCRELDILDLQPFFESAAFADARFSLSEDGGVIRLARV